MANASHDAGIPIIPGTALPAYSLHHEIELYVRVGIPRQRNTQDPGREDFSGWISRSVGRCLFCDLAAHGISRRHRKPLTMD